MIWWFIAAFIGHAIKGICGFANTLVFSSIMGFTQNNILITPVDLVLNFPANAIMVWKGRKEIRWHLCLPLAALMVLGNIPGMFMLKNINAQLGKVIFGFVIIAVGANMLLRSDQPKKEKESNAFLLGIGLLSGLLCGIYGIGVLAAVFMSRVTDDPRAFKANACVVFLINGIFRIVAYSILGIITLESLKLSFMLFPMTLTGLWCGIKLSSKMNDKLVKKIVNVMLIISGVVLVVSNL